VHAVAVLLVRSILPERPLAFAAPSGPEPSLPEAAPAPDRSTGIRGRILDAALPAAIRLHPVAASPVEAGVQDSDGTIEGVVVDELAIGVTPFTVGIESFSGAQARSPAGGGARSFEDPRGAFRWEKLAPGTYVLTASASGKPPTRSEPIDVVAGAVATVRIVLPEGGSVTGHVYDESRVPLEGVELRFDAVSAVLESGAVAKSDRAGAYRLDGAPAGLLTLRAQKDGFRVHLLSGLLVAAHGTLVQDVVLTAVDGGRGLELGGIGANLVRTDKGISLASVSPGDPAERAGLHAGDLVVRIDGEETDLMSLADALQRIRGEAGTVVGLSVMRLTGETLDVVITRGAIVR
jgi:hypothetical protein